VAINVIENVILILVRLVMFSSLSGVLVFIKKYRAFPVRGHHIVIHLVAKKEDVVFINVSGVVIQGRVKKTLRDYQIKAVGRFVD